ncbi:YesL family protein [Alkalicoccus chagannorensis]|uniref:YesL family protein n=1 Tax=Alkalicoccus chagannorensis TaxID=427072 RepID=UPI00047D28F1|nr:DUF624 domain-containing protein [Alkalicoccus chagannorensis]
MFGPFYQALNDALEWVLRVIYLHVLWILFTLAGGIVFGWMPATLAVYAVLRKLFTQKVQKITIFPLFWNEYKQNFLKKAFVGFIFLALTGILYVDFLFYQYMESFWGILFFIFVFLFAMVLTFLYVYFPPLYAHFNLRMKEYFKQSILFGFIHPFTTVVIVLSIGTYVVASYFLPVLILFFGWIPIALFIMKATLFKIESSPHLSK